MPYLVSLPKMANWLRKTLPPDDISAGSAGFSDLMHRYMAYDLDGSVAGVQELFIEEVQGLLDLKESRLALLSGGLDECGNMHDLLCEYFGSTGVGTGL